jgi:hypothetical protein
MSVTLNQPSGLTEPQTNVAYVSATPNADGTYTVYNDGEGEDGAFSTNVNDAAQAVGAITLYSDPNDVQVQAGAYYPSTRALEFDLRAANGFNYVVGADNATSYVGAIVGWNSDSILIRIYSGLNPTTHAPVGPQPNYYVISAESLASATSTNGVPQISGAVFGQDPTVLQEAAQALGLSVTISCFAAGTRILTARGEVPVESLAVGETVITAGGRPAPIRWIGRRTVDCASAAVPDSLRPVRIRAGAFGDGLPRRGLCLSPDHAVFQDGVLIPVRRLLTPPSIAAMPVARCTYYHVELARHDLLLAEGLAVESYLEIGERDSFAPAGPAMPRAADHASRTWEAEGYAPLVVSGPALAAVRNRLRQIARALWPADAAPADADERSAA